jgi:integrase
MRKSTERRNFTARSIESIPIPQSGRVHVYDSKVPSLGLRIEANGRRSFFWYKWIQGRPTFQSIGTWPSTSIKDAQDRAQELNAKAGEFRRHPEQGNPFEKPASEPTLEKVFKEYLETRVANHARHKEKAVATTTQQFRCYLHKLAGRTLSSIRRSDVSKLHVALGNENGHYAANRAIELLKRIFAFAQRQELWDGQQNPAVGVERYHETKRSRFLQPHELEPFLQAVEKEGPDLFDFVRLSLLTGARKNTMLSMAWRDVDFEANSWAVPEGKGDPYVIPLGRKAVAILEARKRRNGASEWVFPSKLSKSGHLAEVKHAWERACRAAGLSNLRVHDLRRTYASAMLAAGIPLATIARSLGHSALSKAVEVYARLNLDSIRTAVERGPEAMLAANGGKKKAKQLLPA